MVVVRTVPVAVAEALDEAHSMMKRINAGIWTRDYRELAEVVQRAYHASLDIPAVEAVAATTDGCEFCGGTKGGVPGNADLIEGHVVCDACHALLADIEKSLVARSMRNRAAKVGE